ncbi:unnamed protein product [Rotaria sp. Silwood1]|nr:unnamed protein product [Rotaria sp. Silwood1]
MKFLSLFILVYFIERLQSIWFENCINIHFLLSSIDKQSLKNIIIRHSTCDYIILKNFLDQLDTVRYLDLASLQIIKLSNQTNEQLYLSSKLKTCSLNSTILKFYSFLPHISLRSIELIDINVDILSMILNQFQSLKIMCLLLNEMFFSSVNINDLSCIPIRSSLDTSLTQQYAALIKSLSDKGRSTIREIDPTNELLFFRIRTKKYEILVAPDKEYTMIVLQATDVS